MKKLAKTICALALAFSVCGSSICVQASSLTPLTPDETTTEETIVSEDETTAKEDDLDAVGAEDNTEDTVNVLFVGNSFTKRTGYNLGTIFSKMAVASGKDVNVKTIAHGSAHLSYYAYASLEYASYFLEMTEALSTQQWDYIVFQEYTLGGIEAKDEMLSSLKTLKAAVNVYQTKAKVLLYMTSGYSGNNANGVLTTVDSVSKRITATEMQKYVAATYFDFATKLDVQTVPVGTAFSRWEKLYSLGAISSSAYTGLVNTDNKHPNYAGYYLAASAFYKQIFGTGPMNGINGMDTTEITEAQALGLQSIVNDSISLSSKTETVAIGANKTVTVSGNDMFSKSSVSNTSCTWESMNPLVATVSNGVITGVSEGSTVIMVTSETGLQAACSVTVEKGLVPATSVVFYNAEYSVAQGDVFKLTANIQPATTTDTFTWSSSNKRVATIDANGTVTALAPGATTIKIQDDFRNVSTSYILRVVLNVPQNLTIVKKTAASLTDTQTNFRIKWDAVTNADSYDVYRSTSKNGTYQKIGSTTKNYYTDKKRNTNKSFYYKVCACDSAGSAYSSLLSSSVRGYVPNIPDVIVCNYSRSAVKTEWKRNNYATGYVVYRSNSNNSGYKKIATISKNTTISYIDKTVTAGKTYYYRIRAYKTVGTQTFFSNNSETLKVKTVTMTAKQKQALKKAYNAFKKS